MSVVMTAVALAIETSIPDLSIMLLPSLNKGIMFNY